MYSPSKKIHELESRMTSIAMGPDVGFDLFFLFLRRLKFLNEVFSIRLRSGTIRKIQRTRIVFHWSDFSSIRSLVLLVAGSNSTILPRTSAFLGRSKMFNFIFFFLL